MAKKQLRKSEWERQLNAIPVSKEDLNRLIMDYLVIEGYKDAAESFSVESGLSPLVDLESIENRMVIRGAIHRGDVEEAIGRVNELDPEILDNNPLLFFHLQQQRLIELIRAGSINEALEFASENLAPRGEEHPDLLPELERTMALLAFDITKAGAPAAGSLAAPPHIAELLAPSQRLKTAAELNAAILASQSQGRDPKLPQLIKMLKYGEELLGMEGPGKWEFPKLDLEGPLTVSTATSSYDTSTARRGGAMAV
ncbi:related to Glucose-induced degradation protein 8 homolog [Pseudozyma flocculosa]|nr:related to Glucose-induced degradation protein 8 homolog [Pseudozyma flocculosa]